MKVRKGGKYYTHVEPKLTLVEGWARDGLIDKQIAKNLGIAYSTFNLYKNKYSEFSDALKKGKEVVDYEVENALLKKALGYTVSEETEELIGDELVVTKVVTKHIPPETLAQIYWLKNRRPDKWRDKPRDDTDSSGELEKLLKGLVRDE